MNIRTARNLTNDIKVQHYFFGRLGGVSHQPWDSLNTCYNRGDVKAHVDQNRARICTKLAISTDALYTPKQVHGTKSIRITKNDCQNLVLQMEADAVWTTDAEVAVSVQTADCAPILLASDDGFVVGAIHAGWRGAVSGIATKTIEHIGKELSIPPNRFIAAIGPCIGMPAFEVGPEVIDAVLATGDYSDVIKKGIKDRFHLDLAGLIEKQLHNIGVKSIEIIRRCTASHTDEYFSYRGNKALRGDQLSVIMKKSI